MKTLFCPNCMVEVEAVMSPVPGGKVSPRCSICGTVIDDAKALGSVDRLISLDEQSFVDESISIPVMDTVIISGYSPGVRQVLLDKMVERNLARKVLAVENGEEMLVEVISRLSSQKTDGKLDLIVLDVPMPYLNGINAAIGLRAIERTYPDHDLIPLLFLTNKPCDDTFKKVIRFLSPAKYATLGPVDDKEKLIKHLHRILGLVAKEKW